MENRNLLNNESREPCTFVVAKVIYNVLIGI